MKSRIAWGVSLLALIAGATAAQAADLPARMPVKAPPAIVAPVFTWTGPYIGINAGYGWGNSDRWGGAAPGSLDVNGALIGATAGYNWQFNQAVFGLEGDINWSDISGNGTCTGFGCSTKNEWLGTARGRLGYAMGQWMPYVTGGFAFGNIKATTTTFGTSDTTNVGWTVGAGVEAALWGPVSAKVEYLYVDLGKGDIIPGTAGTKADFTTNIVRAGLNYRF